MGLFTQSGHTFGMKEKIKYQKGTTIALAAGAQKQWSQRHCTSWRGTLGIYTQGAEENDCHHPMNCFMFCYSTSKIHNRLSKLLKIRGKKRDRESHTRVAISTVVRYSFWTGTRDCFSPEILNQQPRGILFPLWPRQQVWMKSVLSLQILLHY